MTVDTPGEGKHERDEPEGQVHPMSEARLEEPTRLGVPPQIVRLLTKDIPAFSERVTNRIQAEIPSYAGPTAGRRRKLITMAVSESAAVFARRLSGHTISGAGVDDLFRRMGYGEAQEGHGLDALETALRLAGRVGWHGLQDAVVTAGLSAATLGQLGEDLATFLDHLAAQARAGHAMAVRQRERDVTGNRQQLFEALLAGAEPDVVQEHAELTGWPTPAKVVLIAAATAGTPIQWPDSDDLDGHTLTLPAQTSAMFLTAAEHAESVIAQVKALGPEVTIAHTWAMPLTDIAQASRWTTRALHLAAVGALPRQQVIDCTRFRTQLWLHAEPALRRQLAQELLKPLFAETPNSREILSETLLVWLETRESAPAIAAILGVHPQTVRYRWRRINELFGEALHDAEFVVQLTMVLKASVPLWVAGDQSDFERYWSEEPL